MKNKRNRRQEIGNRIEKTGNRNQGFGFLRVWEFGDCDLSGMLFFRVCCGVLFRQEIVGL